MLTSRTTESGGEGGRTCGFPRDALVWLYMQLHCLTNSHRWSVFPVILAGLLSIASLPAQSPAAPPTTHVLAILTLKDGVARDQLMKVMPGEVRATVELYLDGRIQQWYSRGDGKGVVFVLDCKTVEEAKGLMDALPLSKAKFASFEYMPLGPLMPLRLLLGPPAQ